MLFRTYGKGRILGHTRGKRNSKPNTSLVQIEGAANKEEAQFYLGKASTIAIYPSKREILPSHKKLTIIVPPEARIRIPGEEGDRWLEATRYLGVSVVFHPSVLSRSIINTFLLLSSGA